MKIKEFLSDLLDKRREEEEDVLLIHVDSFYNLLYSFYNLGLLSLGTMLKHHGFKVRCISSGNMFFLNYYRMKIMIQKFSPRLVGFYINSDNIHNVKKLATDIKSWIPGVRIVVGGPLATIMKGKLLENACFDFVVIGEGEYPLLGLATYYLRGEGTLKEIPSLFYRQDGEVVSNPRGEPVKDLDSLPPIDFSLIDVSYGFFYSSGRGCPYKCSFCFQEVHGQGYRFYSADRVVNDIIRNAEKYNAKTVNIVDDTFVADTKRVEDICTKLMEKRRQRKLDFVFFCEGRVDIFSRHLELLEKLKDAGMARLQIGVESGDQATLEHYRKRIRLEQIEQVVEKLGKLGGVSVYGNFIIGGPFETEKIFQKTLDFARKLINLAPGQFECASSFLTAFPGTEIGENPEKFGLKIVDRQWLKGLTMSDPSCETEELSVNDIREHQRIFHREVEREMRRVAMKMEPLMMEKHFVWALNYKMHTIYYLNVLARAPILESYFTMKKSVKFKRLREIPDDQLRDWLPIRILESRTYNRGAVELPGYFTMIKLNKPDDILVYEYSAGKMTIGEIAQKIKEEKQSPLTESEIIQNVMLPVYRKIEKSYHIIFYH